MMYYILAFHRSFYAFLRACPQIAAFGLLPALCLIWNSTRISLQKMERINMQEVEGAANNDILLGGQKASNYSLR